MAIFSYQGRNEQTGEMVVGLREAPNHAQLGQDLLQEGVLLTRYSIQKKQKRGASLWESVFERVPLLERILFTRYFALMLRAGLDVKQSLQALATQIRSRFMKKAVEGIVQAVERGVGLSDAMRDYPMSFSDLFISFVKVGENTGRLQESLQVLSVQMQKEYELRRAIKGGLMYPAVILIALIAVGFAMLVFVVPKLADVFEGFEVELPMSTQVLIWIGDFFEHFWWLVIIGGIILVSLVWMLLMVKSIRDMVMHGFLFVPVVGSIMKQINLARFARNLSSLLQSGVNFVDALGIMGENTPHNSYAQVLLGARAHVRKGKLLSEYLVVYNKLFPPIVVNVVKVGEETGALDEVLQEIAMFYEEEVDQIMKNLTSVMEPILMVVIGVAVAALAIAVISPIYGLVNVI
jgi:type II secretory pathway component PulF